MLESAIPKKNLKGILKGKVKSWKYMLQASENYNNIQEPRKEQKLGRYFTIKIVRQNMPFIKEHIKKKNGMCNMQPTVCR